MNLILAEKYNRLAPVSKKAVKKQFAEAPRALKLLTFLEAHEGMQFSMSEIVNAVYPEKHIPFQVRQNRFFKLRQKMMDVLGKFSSETGAVGNLLPLEKIYYDCRDKMHASHFHVAAKGFIGLIRQCREKNVFELMHLAYSGLIYCRQALNDRRDQMRLQDEYNEAIELNHDLNKAQAMHRRMYAYNSERRFEESEKLIDEMRKLAATRKAWPRFRYYLAFIEMTIGRGAPGQDVELTRNSVHNVEMLHKKYKDMPCAHYEAYYNEVVFYNIHMIRGILYFATGDAESAYHHIRKAFDIADQTPGIRIRKTDSLYINLITVSVGTARYEESIKFSEQLIEFHRTQKEENKRLAAYATLAMIYTYCFDKIPCPDPEFILKKLDEYIRSEKKVKGPGVADAYATKAVFLFMMRRYSQVVRIMRRPDLAGIFDRYGLPEYTELLKLNPASTKSRILNFKKSIQQKIRATQSTEVIQHYKRALKLLELV